MWWLSSSISNTGTNGMVMSKTHLNSAKSNGNFVEADEEVGGIANGQNNGSFHHSYLATNNDVSERGTARGVVHDQSPTSSFLQSQIPSSLHAKRDDQNSPCLGVHQVQGERTRKLRGIIYFRSIQPSDRAVIQCLHEQWFPVDYKSDFFDGLCNGRIMPGTSEPLYSCVACFKELENDEFEELKDASHAYGREQCSMGDRGMLFWSKQQKQCILRSVYVDDNECLLWESDSCNEDNHDIEAYTYNGSQQHEIGEGSIHAQNTQRLLSTSNPPNYSLPPSDNGTDVSESVENGDSLHQRTEREKLKRFYSNGFRFDSGIDVDECNGKRSRDSKSCNSRNGGSRPKLKRRTNDGPYFNDSGERIVGCLVGSFLQSSMPSNRCVNSLEEKTERNETAKLLIPDPCKHSQMFYIMTLGTAREFRRTGLGSLLVNRVVELINAKPECGALYLHVITYNSGAIRLYERLGFSRVKEIEDYYTIHDVNYNCLLYARYFHGNRGHKSMVEFVVERLASILRRVVWGGGK